MSHDSSELPPTSGSNQHKERHTSYQSGQPSILHARAAAVVVEIGADIWCAARPRKFFSQNSQHFEYPFFSGFAECGAKATNGALRSRPVPFFVQWSCLELSPVLRPDIRAHTPRFFSCPGTRWILGRARNAAQVVCGILQHISYNVGDDACVCC